MTTNHGLAGARQALYYYGVVIDDRLLTEVLDENQALVRPGQAFDWTDTDIRDDLLNLVTGKLLGRQWPTYGDVQAGREVAADELDRQLMVAHSEWVERQA